MTTITPKTARTPFLGHYLLVLILAMVGLMALDVAMGSLLAFDLPPGAVAIIPPMLAALLTGNRWANKIGVAPEARAAWRLALVGGALYGAIQLGIGFFGLATYSAAVGEPAGMQAMVIILAFSLVLAIVAGLVNRWFIGMGARGALKGR
ncbi:ABZJ_00895 family protein [Jannaschia sp. S6380]|uniref:ABZJ_00895 family protein n=1 Tax=Jannaschia sp. S6380 TaxID=2926408 RepID=UPI001FF48D5F|nr:ABZJ_00895 family protein [Jannaschia sp. S6380]MCK0166959.1 ABZJ_00895 family protein [Jannaschia sp. S6380]